MKIVYFTIWKVTHIRRLEIIGEAVKNLPPEFRQKYPNVNWQDPAISNNVETIATDNVKDFRIFEITILNPFISGEGRAACYQ